MDVPPKPKEGAQDLAEVERALSVLQGRHPEHERARREDEAARQKRAAELEAERAAAAKELLRKRLVYGGTAAAILVLGTLGAFAFRAEAARRGAIERATDPYRAMGFVIVQSSSRTEPTQVATNGVPGCYLAVSTTPEGAAAAPVLDLDVGELRVNGPAPVLACTCEPTRVAVRGPQPTGGEGTGLSILRIDAAAIGGSRAAAFLPFVPGTIARTDDRCAEANLDAWLAAKRGPKPPVDEAFLADPSRATLVRAGFTTVATLKPDVPFAPFSVPKESCVLVAGAADPVAIRAPGGALLVPETAGPMGTCAQAEQDLLLVRGEGEAKGDVHVLVTPAAKVGGLAGLRELARLVDLPLAAHAIAPSERAWSAKQTLLAAAVPEQLVDTASTPTIPPSPDARIVVLSFATPNALTSESPDGVFSFCEPALDAHTTDAICTFSGPQTWHLGSKDAVAGIARAKLPFWLFALETANDPVALKVETQMVALSRRLRFEGFEPTTLEAITETDRGADVLGRTGEDAVVAVALAPIPPFAYPLTDGPAWTLDGTPRVVPTKPLEKVSLVATTRGLPSAKDKRRTVVYRRQAAKR